MKKEKIKKMMKILIRKSNYFYEYYGYLFVIIVLL